jgi:hypothetical protein
MHPIIPDPRLQNPGSHRRIRQPHRVSPARTAVRGVFLSRNSTTESASWGKRASGHKQWKYSKPCQILQSSQTRWVSAQQDRQQDVGHHAQLHAGTKVCRRHIQKPARLGFPLSHLTHNSSFLRPSKYARDFSMSGISEPMRSDVAFRKTCTFHASKTVTDFRHHPAAYDSLQCCMN